MEIRKIYSEFNTPVYLSKALNLYYGGWEICCPMHTFGPAYIWASNTTALLNSLCNERQRKTLDE